MTYMRCGMYRLLFGLTDGSCWGANFLWASRGELGALLASPWLWSNDALIGLGGESVILNSKREERDEKGHLPEIGCIFIVGQLFPMHATFVRHVGKGCSQSWSHFKKGVYVCVWMPSLFVRHLFTCLYNKCPLNRHLQLCLLHNCTRSSKRWGKEPMVPSTKGTVQTHTERCSTHAWILTLDNTHSIDTRTNKVIAIKVLNLDTEEDDVDDIQREIALLSQLTHARSQNITPYYGSFLNDTKLWIIMAYAAGGSVRTIVTRWTWTKAGRDTRVLTMCVFV